MNKRHSTTFAVTLVILLALSAGIGRAQAPAPAGGNPAAQGVSSQPAAPPAVAAIVRSRISYQGVLTEGGAPATGTRNLVFRLYSNNTCTAQVGGDISKPGVALANGLFSVELDVDQALF